MIIEPKNKKYIDVESCFYIHFNNTKYHIVDFLDNEDYPQIIYKFYDPGKCWRYKIESIFSFAHSLETGIYYQKK